MKERIKALAEQAGMDFSKNLIDAELVFGTYEGRRSSYITSSELEKFAQLIILECVAVAAKHDACINWVGPKIKQHFGVEE